MKSLECKEMMFARWLGGGPVTDPPLHLLGLALISVAGGVY